MQLDYILFVHGFALIFMAAMLWPVVPFIHDRLPWRWLMAFAVSYGLHEWLCMLALVLGDSRYFGLFRLVLMAISFAALFEFGRRYWAQGRSGMGAWSHAVLLLLSGLGAWEGWDGLGCSIRCAYGLPAALLVGAALIRSSRGQEPVVRRPLLALGCCWAAYGLSLAAQGMAVWWTSIHAVGSESADGPLGMAEGVPLHLASAVLAVTLATGNGTHLARRSDHVPHRLRWAVPACVLAIVLMVGGYFVCEGTGAHAKRVVMAEMETRLAWLADNLKRQTETLSAMAHTMAGSPHIAPALEHPSTETQGQANAVLDRYASGISHAVTYLIDGQGLTVASSNRAAQDSFVGKRFAFRPYFQTAIGGRKGRYFALGVVSGERGLYCSAPVYSQVDRRILGVTVVKYAFSGSEAFFPASSNYVLLSPENVVFLSGNPSWALRMLYPLPAAELERIRSSRQFGERIFPALLPGPPEDPSALFFGGEFCCFLHRSVGEGWSIAMIEPLRTLALYRLFAIFVVMLLGLLLTGAMMGLLHSALQSERNFREVFNSSKDPMFLYDMTGRIVDVNTAAVQVFGLSPANLAALRIGEISAEEEGYTAEKELARFKEALEREQVRFEWRSRRLTGGCFWTEVTLHRSEIGGRDRVLAVVRDIDERKKAEQTLRDSEEHFRQLFENMSSGVVVCEAEGQGSDFTVQHMNAAAERILAVHRGQAAGRSLRALYTGDTEALWLQCSRVAKTGEAQFMPAAEYMLGQELKWIEHRFFRLPSGRIVCLIENRTGIRALEERLRQSEKMCAIGQLAGGIAHDFSNQLTAVLGCADLLRSHLTDGRQRQFADLIMQAARRSRDLTRQLLAFARRGKYLTVPVDLHSVIDEVVLLVERSFPKAIRIRRELGAEAATTVGDPTQIQNALLNLALNARDAMPEGGELMFETDLVTLDHQDNRGEYEGVAAGTYVRIRAVDTGVGMDGETLKHIYEPFFTTKPTGAGTGLGLSAVYGTMQNHHGAMAVSSEPGKGTTFELLFPLVRCTASEMAAAEPTAVPRKHAHVLVVDDEEVVCRMVPEMLKELGCTAIVFMDGVAAVDYYRLNWRQIDLVILDMRMPGMDGRETFRAMRSINPAIRALLASGYSVDGEAQALLAEGVKGFLQKPFEVAEFARGITETLGEGVVRG